MELPDPRHPRLVPPRPSLVDDFFASPARPRSVSGKPAPMLLHPGSRLTGQPLLDARPIGSAKLAHPEYLIVELSDGRPGLVAVADLTRVWTQPRYHNLRVVPTWWDNFRAAIAPKAGFILYAPDSVLPNAEDYNQYLRHGYVYYAVDVGMLKQAMDMTGTVWAHADTPIKWFNSMMNIFAYPFRNAQSIISSWGAGKTVVDALTGPPKPKLVQERIMGKPKVKLVVYSGHKVSQNQISRDSYNYGKKHKSDSEGDGHYFSQLREDGTTTDSAYTIKAYNKGRFVGNIVSVPKR